MSESHLVIEMHQIEGELSVLFFVRFPCGTTALVLRKMRANDLFLAIQHDFFLKNYILKLCKNEEKYWKNLLLIHLPSPKKIFLPIDRML